MNYEILFFYECFIDMEPAIYCYYINNKLHLFISQFFATMQLHTEKLMFDKKLVYLSSLECKCNKICI